MNFSIIPILIVCAFSLLGGKSLKESYQNGTLGKSLEKAARKALQLTFMGIAAVGVFCLALLLFPLLRVIGFAILPMATIDYIRAVMEAIFDTRSVYATLQILASCALFAAGVSLIFSVLGFVAVRMLFVFCFVERSFAEQGAEYGKSSAVAIPRTFRKIFLSFANLRI